MVSQCPVPTVSLWSCGCGGYSACSKTSGDCVPLKACVDGWRCYTLSLLMGGGVTPVDRWGDYTESLLMGGGVTSKAC